MEVMTQEELDNEMFKISKHILFKRRIVFGLFIAVICGLLITLAWSSARAGKAQRELAESNRLVEQYRERDVETARINRELAERNQRLETGVNDIRELASSAGGNIRQAINIISGVKSVIETLEDSGTLGNSSGAADRSPDGIGD
jgi:ABC-type transporter Mla subunit MlaD